MGRRRNRGRGNRKRGGANGRPPLRRFDADDWSSGGGSGEMPLDVDEPLAFGIGARVELPNLKEEGGDDASSSSCCTGTVVGHWKRRDHWPDRLRAPYVVLLDDGTAVYCHRTDEEFMRETNVPPMRAAFNLGARVECRIERGNPRWFPGTIVQRNVDWAASPFDAPPYFVRFDYGRERPFWGPEDRIRLIGKSRKASPRFAPLRFDLGDRVVCSVEGDWVSGQVVRTWYTEEEFEEGFAVPYQLLLDSGDFIYAPLDDDDCIRRSSAPPVPLRFSLGDRVKCKVEEGWLPGMIINTQYTEEGLHHGGRIVPYEIKLDMGDVVYAPCDNDLFVKKQLRFTVGARVECLTDDGWKLGIVKATDYFEDAKIAPYQIQLDNGPVVFANIDSDSCIKKSNAPRVCKGGQNGLVHVLSKFMIYNEEYESAAEMLQERLTLIRSAIKNNPDDEDVACLRGDLSTFLCHLSEVYQAMGSLNEMRAALDEALELIEVSQDNSKSHRLLNVTAKLATHAALTSDKYAALLFSEEGIILAKETSRGKDSFRLGLMLFQCGKLNVACMDRERGLEQMTQGIEILRRLYGCDNKHVQLMADDLRKITISKGEDLLI